MSGAITIGAWFIVMVLFLGIAVMTGYSPSWLDYTVIGVYGSVCIYQLIKGIKS